MKPDTLTPTNTQTIPICRSLSLLLRNINDKYALYTKNIHLDINKLSKLSLDFNQSFFNF